MSKSPAGTNLERELSSHFGIAFDIAKRIVVDVAVAREVRASVFLTKKKQLFCYIYGQSSLTLGDVRQIISRMGLRPELCLPPKGQPRYFDEVAALQFRKVFPGLKPNGDQDLAYYRTLAPYNPALVLIAEVKDGHIYQFDPDARTKWRVAAKFVYHRVAAG
ncbi:hypothetical protein CR983_03275 [Candidatus Saccharibacteria bacterium]|nr:MAG: hypothetical protein CR983_03275 [Candidatus Saccharibacteria bacterium]